MILYNRNVDCKIIEKGSVCYVSYEKMIAEKAEMEQKIDQLKKLILELPDGELQCAGNGRYCKWYCKQGGQRRYLSKKERKLAEQLAKKKYLSLQLEDLLHEKEAVEVYLKYRENHPSQAARLVKEKSEYQKMILPQLHVLENECMIWQNSSYKTNHKYPEQLIYKTNTGLYVRSKSEMLICMLLQKYGIPFRYECELELDGKIIYPDFTIMHPKTGKLFYYEHFGMMDDDGYCRSACAKIQLYATNGIVPSIQLITTFETQEHPLLPETVEGIIKQYFL